MRLHKLILGLLVVVGIFMAGCSKTESPVSPTLSNQGLSFNMDLSAIGQTKFSISRVTAYISKGSYTDSLNLTISGLNAYGSFTALQVGTYNVIVKAFSNDTLLAIGQGKAYVKPAELTKVFITLRYVGELEIWIGYIPWENLVAEYIFNGNALDESGNGFDGEVFGATLTTDRFGKADKAYWFNGDDNYIGLAKAADMGLTNSSFSVSAWFNVDAFDHCGDETILGNDVVYNTYCGLTYVIRTDTSYSGGTHVHNPLMSFYGEPDYSVYSDEYITENSWYHMVFVYDAVNKLKSVYINGQLDTTSTCEPYIGTEQLLIGRWGGGYVSHGKTYFYGKIDDMRIYNKTLNQEEVFNLYHENGWDW